VLFERGRFGPDDTLRTASALAAFALAAGFVLVKALTPGFFAREDNHAALYRRRRDRANVALNMFFLLARSSRRSHRTRLVFVGAALTRRSWHRPAAARTMAAGRPPRGRTLGIFAAPRHGRLVWGTCVARACAAMQLQGRHGAVRAASWARGYAVLGILVGVLNLSELKAVMNRGLASDQSTQSNHRDARPAAGGLDEGITSTQSSWASLPALIVVAEHGAGLAIIPGLRNDAPPCSSRWWQPRGSLRRPAGKTARAGANRSAGRPDREKCRFRQEAHGTSLATATEEARQCCPARSKGVLGTFGIAEARHSRACACRQRGRYPHG